MIAKARKPGHFVIVIPNEKGERIPLTIADADVRRGTITLVTQAIGDSTAEICAKEPGDCLHDVVGPLGRATDIRRYGTVVCCGGGVGVAPLLPILRQCAQPCVLHHLAQGQSLLIRQSRSCSPCARHPR